LKGYDEPEILLSQLAQFCLIGADAEQRKEYGGLELDQAKRMKELERENIRLKRLVADLSLEKQVLKDVASGNL